MYYRIFTKLLRNSRLTNAMLIIVVLFSYAVNSTLSTPVDSKYIE